MIQVNKDFNINIFLKIKNTYFLSYNILYNSFNDRES